MAIQTQDCCEFCGAPKNFGEKIKKLRASKRRREKEKEARYRVRKDEALAFLVYCYALHPSLVQSYRAEIERRKLLRWRLKNHVRRINSMQGGNRKRVSLEVVEKLRLEQKGKCTVCRKPLGDGWQVDHIMPISAGGSNDPHNLQLLCRPCNQSKYNKQPGEFAKERGLLL